MTRVDIPPVRYFTVTAVHFNQDLRSIQWRADVLREHVKEHQIKEGRAHVFINKDRDRARVIVVWKGVPFLIMLPARELALYDKALEIAASFTPNTKLRERLLAEISEY